MRKVVSIGPSVPLAYHNTGLRAGVPGRVVTGRARFIGQGIGVQNGGVNSLVEFEIPLRDTLNASQLLHIPDGGFSYQGSYYAVA